MAEQRRNKLYNESFEALFSHYAKGMVVYAREFLFSPQEAEDIVHDVFVSLWEKIDSLSADTAKAYLFRATRNRCLDHLKHLKVRSAYQEKILVERDAPDALETDYYIETELKGHIEAIMNSMPPQRRKVFMMSRMEGKSAQEIAAEVNLSPRTVEKHIELALKHLKIHLSHYILGWLILLMDKM